MIRCSRCPEVLDWDLEQPLHDVMCASCTRKDLAANWYDDPTLLARFVEHLVFDADFERERIAEVIDKPHKWTVEFLGWNDEEAIESV